LVRKDIPLSAQVVQVGHACLEAGRKFPQPSDGPSILVVLAVSSEDALVRAVERVNRRGVQTVVFCESDNSFGYTAACTEPVNDQQRIIFRTYPLWRG
jgi:hypothetical protein